MVNPPPLLKAMMTEELEFFQNTATGRLGVLTRNRTDNDYGYAVLAHDKGAHRAINFRLSIESRDAARAQLLAAL